jgi:hypothetical protein
MNVKRVSIEDMKLRDPDIFTDKKVIGAGTFG